MLSHHSTSCSSSRVSCSSEQAPLLPLLPLLEAAMLSSSR
jgi:hypothetical protein